MSDKGQENTWETLEKARIDDQALQDVHAKAMVERGDPKEGFSFAPIAIIFVFATIVFWAGIYQAHNSGKFNALAYDPVYKEPVKDDNSGPTLAEKIEKGKGIYMGAGGCFACHLPNGAGNPIAMIPPLAQADWVLGAEERAISVILYGLAGKITVNGKDYNSVMPPPAGLSDKQIAQLLTYIRINPEWGNSASEVTEAQVAEVRKNYKPDGPQWNPEALIKLWPVNEADLAEHKYDESAPTAAAAPSTAVAQQTTDPTPPPAQTPQEAPQETSSATATTASAFERGKKVYNTMCFTCHMADGKGMAPLNPPLHKNKWVAGEPDRMIAAVLYGLMGPITVNKKQYNGGMMTPLGTMFNDQQVADVLTFIRANKDWGNDFPAVSPELVAEVRERHKGKAMWTVEELLKVYPFGAKKAEEPAQKTAPPPPPAKTPEPAPVVKETPKPEPKTDPVPDKPKTIVFEKSGPPPAPDQMERGKIVYDRNCIQCHKENGQGTLSNPPLLANDWVNGKPEKLIAVLLHGLQGDITINGELFKSRGPSPSFDYLSDEQIADVITYVRNNEEWGNQSGAVTAAQVKKIREKYKDKKSFWNEGILNKVFR